MAILKVEGMHCEGCVKRVTEGLQAEGIAAEVSLENKTVTVEGDKGTVEKAVSEIEDLGFDVML